MTNNKEVRQFSDLTDVECLSLSELTGCADHLSEQSQIHQVRELFQNNGFYNRQTNLPGRIWLKIIDYLRLIGIDVGDTTRARSKIEGEWQLCPKCNGDGNLARYNSPSIIGTDDALLCDVCNGSKIISKPVFESSKVEGEDNEGYWKQRCLAAELNIETYSEWMMNCAGEPPKKFSDLYKKWQTALSEWEKWKASPQLSGDEERRFTLQEMKDAHTAGVIAGNKQVLCKPLVLQEQYFKEKFQIDIS
jgi:hypothetical protein